MSMMMMFITDVSISNTPRLLRMVHSNRLCNSPSCP